LFYIQLDFIGQLGTGHREDLVIRSRSYHVGFVLIF
jgi:hypothetical protein